jgi:RsiW-degrading membrane proteinase PrsW (M82 family)
MLREKNFGSLKRLMLRVSQVSSSNNHACFKYWLRIAAAVHMFWTQALCHLIIVLESAFDGVVLHVLSHIIKTLLRVATRIYGGFCS